MFSSQTQVMLYVEDVPRAVAFWQSLGFVVVELQEVDGTQVAEITPTIESDLHFVLYDLTYVQAHSPEVNIAAPSIMFSAPDVLALYQKLTTANVELGEVMQLGEQLIFNFADLDGNFFAVSGPVA